MSRLGDRDRDRLQLQRAESAADPDAGSEHDVQRDIQSGVSGKRHGEHCYHQQCFELHAEHRSHGYRRNSGHAVGESYQLGFGNVQVGSNKLLSETVTNTGGSNLTISQANVTGTGFTISGLSLPLTLVPGQSFTFGATFTPVSQGSVTGNIAVISDASNPTLNIALTGTGTVLGQLSVNPTSLSFGNVVVGTNKSLTATLNATTASVTVASATASTAEFVISGLAFPVTIAAGQSATFTVTFTPQASGNANATATFVSDASNSPTVQALTGTGTPAPQHSVDLSWSASNSNDVVGYNVYRGTKTGGSYTKINSIVGASTDYTDATVQAGQTYFYVTTAVDTGGLESTFSNEVKAVVPTP